jgi:hypothetical protein
MILSMKIEVLNSYLFYYNSEYDLTDDNDEGIPPFSKDERSTQLKMIYYSIF